MWDLCVNINPGTLLVSALHVRANPRHPGLAAATRSKRVAC